MTAVVSLITWGLAVNAMQQQSGMVQSEADAEVVCEAEAFRGAQVSGAFISTQEGYQATVASEGIADSCPKPVDVETPALTLRFGSLPNPCHTIRVKRAACRAEGDQVEVEFQQESPDVPCIQRFVPGVTAVLVQGDEPAGTLPWGQCQGVRLVKNQAASPSTPEPDEYTTARPGAPIG